MTDPITNIARRRFDRVMDEQTARSATGRLSQSAAGYSVLGPFRCDNCHWFRLPGSCAIVAGPIAPQGCCDGFERRPGENGYLFSSGTAFQTPISAARR